MKPMISRAKFNRITEPMTEKQRRELAAEVELYDVPAVGIEVDQQRIGARFAELLAAEQPLRDAPGPTYGKFLGATPTYTQIDETHGELGRRWQVLRDRFGCPRQGGKSDAARHFADEYERVTGVRPNTVSVQREPDQQMPPPWRDAGYGSGGATVWVAPIGTPVPSPARGWPKTPEDAAKVAVWALPQDPDPEWGSGSWVTTDEMIEMLDDGRRESAAEFRRVLLGVWPVHVDEDQVERNRRAVRACVERLADESDTPRHLLFDD